MSERLRVQLRDGTIRWFQAPAEVVPGWRYVAVCSRGEQVAVFRKKEVVSVEVADD